MAESIVFTCDMCGIKSEEEPAAFPRRERCRVELVFRGQRFVLEPSPVPDAVAVPWGALPGALPLSPGAAVSPAPWPPLWASDGSSAASQMAAAAPPPPSDEDDRVVYTICDACMKRTCAFFDLKVETFDEYSGRVSREADLARRMSVPLPGDGGGMQGKMVKQYLTPPREPGHGPGPGGLVDQFPTPPSPAPEAVHSAAPVSVKTPETDKKPEAESPPAEA